MSPGQLVEEADERVGQQGPRIGEYRRFLNAYNGERGGGNSAIQGSYADGRPAMRQVVDGWADIEKREGAPNYVYAVVVDLMGIMGVVPDVKVLPQTGDQQHMAEAAKRTRILRETYEHSNLDIQQAQLGFFISDLGDSIYTLDVRTPKEADDGGDPMHPAGVYINVVSPMICFPAFKGGRDARELRDLYIVDDISAEDAKSRFGIDVDDDSEPCKIYTYYSATEKYTVVLADGRKHAVSHVKHDLGFCPAQWVSNQITDGRLAQSDISRAVDLHYEMQSLFHVVTDAVLWATYPLFVVKGGQAAFGSGMEIGPGAVIDVDSTQGSVEMIVPGGNAQSAQMIFNVAKENFMQVAGVAPVRVEGQIDRSNVSSRAVHAQQAPMQSRVSAKQRILGNAMTRMNAKIMLMYSKLAVLKNAEMPLYGEDADGVYSDTFTGADLGGWQRSRVRFDSFTGADTTERTHNALLLYKTHPQGYPWRRVLEEAGEENPAQIMEEAKAAAAAEGPGPGGPPGAPPGQPPGGPPGPGGPGGPPQPPQAPPGPEAAQPPGGPAGGAPDGGSTPPPPGMPGFPPLTQAPGGTPEQPGASVPDVIGLLQAAVAQVQLRGEITDGPKLQQGGVIVLVTDFRDIKPLTDALTPVAKQIDPSYTVTVKVDPAAKAAAKKGK